MTAYRVESAALAQVVSELDALTSYATELIDQVQQIAQGVSAAWSGQANQQYLEAHTEWTQGANQMSQALADIHAFSANSANNYDALGSGVRKIWG